MQVDVIVYVICPHFYIKNKYDLDEVTKRDILYLRITQVVYLLQAMQLDPRRINSRNLEKRSIGIAEQHSQARLCLR